MAPFQSEVRPDQTTGFVGDLILDGPFRGAPAILDSTDAANNVIGRAFRHLAGEDLKVEAGGTGAFAGILANSKNYALQGTQAGGSLAPSLQLANETNVELVQMGTMILDLSLDAPANPSRAIGASIWSRDADGVLVGSTGAGPGAGYTQVPNARIVRNNIVTNDPGLAIVTLTN